MGSDTTAKGGPVLVITTGNKGFYLIEVGLFHAGKFADFMYPLALQLLGCGLIVHVGKCQTV